MRSAVKKDAANPELTLISLLAKHLLSPSPRFEDASHRSRSNAQEGLRCLAALESTTRASFAQLSASESAPPTEPEAVALIPGPAAPQYVSQRPEYKPGLTDRSVVDALLDYHRRKRPTIHSRVPSSEFKPARAAQVAAQPKAAPPRASALRPGSTRIFRPRGD